MVTKTIAYYYIFRWKKQSFDKSVDDFTGRNKVVDKIFESWPLLTALLLELTTETAFFGRP